MRRDGGDVVHRLVGQPALARQVVIDPRRAGIVGGEEAGRAVALVHLPNVAGAGHDVVVRVVRVRTEAVLRLQVGVGRGHQLHQAHRARSRGDGLAVEIFVTTGFLVHHGADPRGRHAETLRGLADVGPPGVVLRTGRRVGAALGRVGERGRARAGTGGEAAGQEDAQDPGERARHVFSAPRMRLWCACAGPGFNSQKRDGRSGGRAVARRTQKMAASAPDPHSSSHAGPGPAWVLVGFGAKPQPSSRPTASPRRTTPARHTRAVTPPCPRTAL